MMYDGTTCKACDELIDVCEASNNAGVHPECVDLGCYHHESVPPLVTPSRPVSPIEWWASWYLDDPTEWPVYALFAEHYLTVELDESPYHPDAPPVAVLVPTLWASSPF